MARYRLTTRRLSGRRVGTKHDRGRAGETATGRGPLEPRVRRRVFPRPTAARGRRVRVINREPDTPIAPAPHLSELDAFKDELVSGSPMEVRRVLAVALEENLGKVLCEWIPCREDDKPVAVGWVVSFAREIQNRDLAM